MVSNVKPPLVGIPWEEDEELKKEREESRGGIFSNQSLQLAILVQNGIQGFVTTTTASKDGKSEHNYTDHIGVEFRIGGTGFLSMVRL